MDWNDYWAHIENDEIAVKRDCNDCKILDEFWDGIDSLNRKPTPEKPKNVIKKAIPSRVSRGFIIIVVDGIELEVPG